MKFKYLWLPALFLFSVTCERHNNSDGGFTGSENEVRLITLNPGHFHAGLIHLHDYHQIHPTVHIYAPEGEELQAHINMVEQFNEREINPTRWNLEIYSGDDYLEQMLQEKPGNVMVVAGNNARKIEYINSAVENGINVLSDKPMIIHPDNFLLLKQTLESADEKGLVVNDMMTERHEITSILQRELSQIPELFGELKKGTAEEPAIIKESVHFFYKTVAGETLIRPPWFFDVTQQGEAIVDVSTHLVDLILWQAFPEEPVDYRNQNDSVEVVTARSWNTDLAPSQFELITNTQAYPGYLLSVVDEDSVLHVAANGEFVFKVRDTYGKVSAQWGFTNPDGGDTHYSIMRGTKANLIIHQDVRQNFQATLYVEPASDSERENFGSILKQTLDSLSDRYEGLTSKLTEFGWQIQIPEEYLETHEEHFTRVTERYLQSLTQGTLPEWERTNLLTKYFLTTQAFELSR